MLHRLHRSRRLQHRGRRPHRQGGYAFASAQIEMVPQNYQKLEKEEDVANMEKMLDIFEDDDDVQNVYHNWEQE